MLTISQFSKLAHITSKTLRYYDEINLLKPIYIDSENSYRYYSSQQIATVMVIQKLKAYECSLADIKLALSGELELLGLLQRQQKQLQQKHLHYTALQSKMEKEIAALAEGGNFMTTYDSSRITVVPAPEWSLVSIRKAINIQEFNHLMADLFAKLATHGLTPSGPPLTIYHSPEFTPENYDVEVAIPIKEGHSLAQPFAPGKCVVYDFVGNYEQIPTVYSDVANWMADNQYELNGSPFEIYLSDPATTPPDDNRLAVYLPIRPQTEGESAD